MYDSDDDDISMRLALTHSVALTIAMKLMETK